MRKFSKHSFFVLISLFILSVFSCREKVEKSVSVAEPETPVVLPGRIIVLVVDISQSISKQLDEIINGLCEKIVDERLESNDYCVVVPLGDASNVDKADSFGIKYSSDKEKIKKYLQSLKAWMPSNLNTDIGAAMRKTFQYVNMVEKENDGNMLDPLVLFITDGEIYQSKSGESLLYDSPDAIFNDSMMNPRIASYDNWWFLGIENEGVPLVNIKNIAQMVNAYPDRYETLSDMSQFGFLFDKWLERIPPMRPKDVGKIVFSDVRLGGILLSSDDSKYTVVPNNADLFTWLMKSEYKVNNVTMTFKAVKGTFQKDSTGESVEFQLVPEVGNIEFTPGAIRETRANVKIPSVSGRGKLKLDINTELNEECDGQIPEYLFFVEFKPAIVLLLEKIFPFILIALILAVIIVSMIIVKNRSPVKIKLSIVGKTTPHPKVAHVKINRRFEFGSKAGLLLQIDGSGVPPVLGSLVRTGKKEWKIEMKEKELFAENQKLDPYILNTSIKIQLKDGSSRIIKFVEVK